MPVTTYHIHIKKIILPRSSKTYKSWREEAQKKIKQLAK